MFELTSYFRCYNKTFFCVGLNEMLKEPIQNPSKHKIQYFYSFMSAFHLHIYNRKFDKPEQSPFQQCCECRTMTKLHRNGYENVKLCKSMEIAACNERTGQNFYSKDDKINLKIKRKGQCLFHLSQFQSHMTPYVRLNVITSAELLWSLLRFPLEGFQNG